MYSLTLLNEFVLSNVQTVSSVVIFVEISTIKKKKKTTKCNDLEEQKETFEVLQNKKKNHESAWIRCTIRKL